MAEQSFKLGLSTKALGKNNGPYEPTAYIDGMGVWDGASVVRKHAALWQAASELIAAVCPLAPRLTLPLALALTLALALALTLTLTLANPNPNPDPNPHPSRCAPSTTGRRFPSTRTSARWTRRATARARGTATTRTRRTRWRRVRLWLRARIRPNPKA